jgi:UPF0755 protein
LLLLAACGVPAGPVQQIDVPRGTTVAALADTLAAHGLIRSAPWFRLRARLRRTDRKLQAGIYRFVPGTSTGRMLADLEAGRSVRFRVTLPVGGTIFDLARSAEAVLQISRDSVLAATRDSAIRHRFGIPGPSAEGWLLPESFDFPAFTGPREVVTRFLRGRQERWTAAWDSAADSAHLSRAELLTLASIVDAEAMVPEDRAPIAAVYRHRLRIGMALQADPTIQYGYLLEGKPRKPRLFNTDYAFRSPWNTYLHPGLPPGPIGNPSDEAIEAVLHPPDVPWLYFVAGPGGRHIFSSSYAEHVRTVHRMQRARH